MFFICIICHTFFCIMPYILFYWVWYYLLNFNISFIILRWIKSFNVITLLWYDVIYEIFYSSGYGINLGLIRFWIFCEKIFCLTFPCLTCFFEDSPISDLSVVELLSWHASLLISAMGNFWLNFNLGLEKKIRNMKDLAKFLVLGKFTPYVLNLIHMYWDWSLFQASLKIAVFTV